LYAPVALVCTRALLPHLLSFSTDTATPERHTLSLHDALPILFDYFRSKKPDTASLARERLQIIVAHERGKRNQPDYLPQLQQELDRKSTRLNSSHVKISYAVFCLKKKTITRSGTYHSPHCRTP